MAYDDTKSSGDPILSADWNAFVTVMKAKASTMSLEQFAGSDCSGSSGATNRVLTTTGASGALGQIIVSVDGTTARKTDKWTISGDDITFLVKIYDSQKIDVYYVS